MTACRWPGGRAAPHAGGVLLSALVALGAAPAGESGRLLDAVKRGDRQAVRTLLPDGVASPHANAEDADGTTALHWAVHRGDLEMADRLLAAGASAGTPNRFGVRPILVAAAAGDASLIGRLLDAGADPNTALNGETALMRAARAGQVEALGRLLDAGARIDAVESWRGQTALMWAAAEGHVPVVKTLVARGADLGARSALGFTALLFAVRQGHIEVTAALLEAGADLNDSLRGIGGATTAGSGPAAPEAGINAVLLAAGNAHYELAALLLDRGADPNAAPRGWTALHQLSWVRKAGIAGSNDPAPEGSGSMDSLAFARKLVAKGANVNARVTKKPPVGVTRLNMIGATPFVLAARTADAEYMRLLAELGADPLLPNEDGSTPLMVAAGLGTAAPGEDPGTEPEVLESVKVALALGGDLNAVDANGETVMHGAVSKHAPSVVRFLAGAGAKIEVWNRTNKEGHTPLDITRGVIRGMNIISSPPTEVAVIEVMTRAGVPPPQRP
jgi:ankyrin repeat protein